jgi:serine/threonine protein kinase
MPVAPSCATDLLDLIVKSGVATAARGAAVVPDPADLPADPRSAARALIQKGLITRFQAQQFLIGRHKGFRLGAHVVLDQLGRGGMGCVYLAEHQGLRRKVAIKVLVPDKGDDQRLAAERFLREARAAAALDHPNIVRIFDVCRHGDVPYLVMEYVEGETLQQTIERGGPLPYETASDVIAQAAAGLQHAHEKGFIHRDIKPGNLIRDKAGIVKILDMGLARPASTERDKLTELLDEGAVVGTADFIAPEQALNAPEIDIRADLYSLGATFFALITGRPPFSGNTTQKLLQHQMATAPLLTEFDSRLPEGLAAVVAKMLEKKPCDRFQTPAEVITALSPWVASNSRVLAGLSGTNLGRSGLFQASLIDPGESSGRLSINTGDAGPDSGVIFPQPTVDDTMAEASSNTQRTPTPIITPFQDPVPSGRWPKRKVVRYGVLGAIFLLSGLAGLILALRDSTPSEKAPAESNVLFQLDLAGQRPFAVRSGLEAKPDGTAAYRPIAQSGVGSPPAGWTARCRDAASEMEFFSDQPDTNVTLGIRNLRSPATATLTSPFFECPTGSCRVAFDYSADVRDGSFSLWFRPTGQRAWQVARPAVGGSVWRAEELTVDLKGGRSGSFEFHNDSADGVLRIRSFTVTALPSDSQ